MRRRGLRAWGAAAAMMVLALGSAAAAAPVVLAAATTAAAPAATGVPPPPALKLAPLKYQAQLPLGKPKTGYVDVSNPLATPLHITSYAQAFRQTDAAGDLQFYADPAVSAGIVPQLSSFDLPPHAAVRAYFTINPNAFGRAGVYAALFFQTTTTAPAAGKAAAITTNVRVGSLMILTIGSGGTTRGTIAGVQLPLVAVGSGIGGTATYRNAGSGAKALGFNPRLTVTAGLLAKTQTVNGPLVLPGSSRQISFARSGSYLGLIPVTVRDASGGGASSTRWVIACTGYWRWVVLVIALGLAGFAYRRRGRKQRLRQRVRI